MFKTEVRIRIYTVPEATPHPKPHTGFTKDIRISDALQLFACFSWHFQKNKSVPAF